MYDHLPNPHVLCTPYGDRQDQKSLPYAVDKEEAPVYNALHKMRTSAVIRNDIGIYFQMGRVLCFAYGCWLSGNCRNFWEVKRQAMRFQCRCRQRSRCRQLTKALSIILGFQRSYFCEYPPQGILACLCYRTVRIYCEDSMLAMSRC